MDQKNTEQFASRWGIILVSLGMAIGAGNLWRFPRLAGQYGGAFIILWILFLFIWSIPLLLSEFAIGKKFKQGVIGSYGQLVGKRYVYLGFFNYNVYPRNSFLLFSGHCLGTEVFRLLTI